MTRSIPEKPIKITMVLDKRIKQIQDSISRANIKEYWNCFPQNEDSHLHRSNLDIKIQYLLKLSHKGFSYSRNIYIL